DVTATTTFTIDDTTLGSFGGAGTTLTVTKAGKTNVRASASSMSAATTITVSAPVGIVTPGTPTGAPGSFGGPDDPSLAPTWVYPSDGVLVPPNMNTLEFHFMPNGSSLFELKFSGTAVDLTVYFTCTAVGSGCVYSPDATAWTYLAEGGRG